MTQKELKAIEDYTQKAMAKSKDLQHDYSHVDRVRKNALEIVKILKIEEEIDKNLLQAACLLHDIVYTRYKFSLKTWALEKKYLKKMIPKIIEKFNLSVSDEYLLTEAIYHHTMAFPFRRLNKKHSLYAQILQDADQIDMISKTRIIDLKQAKSFSKTYKVISLFSGLFVKRMEKKLHRFLNLPEIIKYFQED